MEQLISFETAKLSKQLSFDIPVLNYFYDDVNNVKEYEVEDYPFIAVNWNKNTEYEYSRPTQSLLQKWLRENHNVEIEIKRIGGQYTYECYKLSRNGNNPPIFYHRPGHMYIEYEEALEKALEISLKEL